MLKFLDALKKDSEQISQQCSGGAPPQIDLSAFIRRALRISHDQEMLFREIAELPEQFMRGQRPEIEGLIDVFEHLTPGEENCHFVILYYRCRPLYCDIVHNEQEVAEAIWVPCSELSAYTMPAGACYILGKVFPEFCLLANQDNADA